MHRWQIAFGVTISLMLSALSVSTAIADCNENQAFNKMMAFNQAWSGYQQRYFAMPQAQQGAEFQKFSSGAQRMAGFSAKLAEKKWNEVCAGYDALAKEYGFDLQAASKGMVTMEELKVDGGRRGGICDLGEAAKRYMGMIQKFEDRRANGEVTREQEVAFRTASEPVGYKIQTDPSSVCQEVASLSKKFDLN